MKKIQHLDDPKVTIKRKKIIKKKTFLFSVYNDFYKKIITSLTSENKKGEVIELGSGAGFIKKFLPKAITSDILKLPNIDMQFSATKMPFKKESINAIVMIDVFHHIDNVEKFLDECSRCLKQNGQIIMIEPASTWFGKFIYQHFHHEPYRDTARWAFVSSGPLSGANSALPWIVFYRDRKKFQKKFPQLKIISIKAHTPLLYMLSGGFSYPQFLPDFMLPMVTIMEKLLTPFNSLFGLFYTIQIKKI